MTSGPPSTDAVLAVFGTLDSPGEPLTTAEVAAEFHSDQPVVEVLEALAETESVRTKEIGDGTRVWWRSIGGRETGISRAGLQELEHFRDELTAAIHTLDDPVEIQHEAARVLGERLGVDRAHYADIRDDRNTNVLHADYYRDDVSSIVGEYLLDDYGEHIAATIRGGDTVVVADFSSVPGLSSDQRELYEELSIQAGIAVPLLYDGVLAAYLGITDSTAREWTDTDVAMVEETAELTWIAVQWARAEQRWRESEERLQFAADVANLFSWQIDLETGQFEASMKPNGGRDWSMPSSMAEIQTQLLSEYRDEVHTELNRAIGKCGEFELEAPYTHPETGEVIWTYSAGVAIADGSETATRLVGITQDITDRKEAELELKEQAELNEYRVELADALRPLSDATEIQQTATRILGTRLEADRVVYTGLDDADETLHVGGSYTRDEFPMLTDGVPVSTFGDAPRTLRDGRTLVIPDVTTSSEMTDGQRANTTELDIFSAVVVPLVKDDNWVANLSVHHGTPRAWTDVEVGIVEETAQRTWAAVERAHAEAQLRESETEFRAIANLVPDLLWRNDPDGSPTWCNQRHVEHTGQTLEDVAADGWLDAIHPADRERSLERFQTAIARGEPYRREHRIRGKDGEYRWFLSRAHPVRENGGEITHWFGASTDIHEQRETAVALERLNDATRELIDADPVDLTTGVAELTARVLDTEHCVLWRYDEQTGELERGDSHTSLERTVDSTPTPESPSEQIWDVFVNGEVVARDSRERPDSDLVDGPSQNWILIPLAGHGIIQAVSTRATAFDDRHIDLAETLGAAIEAAWNRAESEQARADQNEELERLDRLNQLLRRIDQALVSADTVDRVYEEACEQLARSRLYEFAWVGTHDSEANTVEPRAWAGVDSEYIETITSSDGGADESDHPVADTLRMGSLQVVADTVTDPAFAPWRAATLQRGARSIVSIPLVYDESQYGVLSVYENRPNPDDRNLDVLAELGRTIAHVIHARETTATAQTDAVVELTLRVTDAGTPLSRLSERADRVVTLDGLVPRSDGEADAFFTMTEASATAVSSLDTRTLSIDTLECLSEQPGESLFRARVGEPTLAARIVGQNAVLRNLTFEAGEATAVVDLAQTVDVRTFLDGLREFYPTVQLLARQPSERPLKTQRTFVATARERLTDRQLEILQTAYLSGYFETPRVTTGQEMVEFLDISQPTFSQHLRAAERSLCELLFEEAQSSQKPRAQSRSLRRA